MRTTPSTPAKRAYRALCVPRNTPADQVEALAQAGGLRTVPVKARDAEAARNAAYSLTGLAVHSVERDAEAVA